MFFFVGPESSGVAITLLALAGISEGQSKPSSETIALLERSNAIFKKVEGENGQNTIITRDHIKRLRSGFGGGPMPPPQFNGTKMRFFFTSLYFL